MDMDRALRSARLYSSSGMESMYARCDEWMVLECLTSHSVGVLTNHVCTTRQLTLTFFFNVVLLHYHDDSCSATVLPMSPAASTWNPIKIME